MMKHIREALKLAGIKASEVEVRTTRNSHVHLRYKGRLIVCASSPKNPHHAAQNIARDLLK